MLVARLLRGVRLAAALAIVAVLFAPPALQAQPALTIVTVGTLSSDNSAAVYYA